MITDLTNAARDSIQKQLAETGYSSFRLASINQQMTKKETNFIFRYNKNSSSEHYIVTVSIDSLDDEAGIPGTSKISLQKWTQADHDFIQRTITNFVGFEMTLMNATSFERRAEITISNEPLSGSENKLKIYTTDSTEIEGDEWKQVAYNSIIESQAAFLEHFLTHYNIPFGSLKKVYEQHASQNNV